MNGSELLSQQQQYFQTGETRSVDFRISQLKKLRQAIALREPSIIQALRADLNKSEMEAYTFEIGLVYKEISFALRHLKRWSKPRKVKTALTHIGSRSYIVPEPLGAVLVIAPWNYPFQLALSPLIGAIAAGNTAVLKPSELAPAASAIMASLIRDTFDRSYLAVEEGGAEESRKLLELPFDKIFFTGSVRVGKLVMEAAAKHLTPVTLELGGKSPCIVHDDAPLQLAAKRIAFGKFINAGQTCIAPDYLLVHRKVKDELVASIREAIVSMYGQDPLHNPDYCKIVSRAHYERLREYLQGGTAVVGGHSDEQSLRIEPTVLEQVTWDMPVMKEEIFGPILPVLTYDDIREAIAVVNARPKPLALYAFTQNQSLQSLITERIPFGGGCINDTLMHLGTPYLPFGGVGESGMGSYHGENSFLAFSHRKSVLKQTTKFDFTFRYPSSKNGLAIIRRLLKP